MVFEWEEEREREREPTVGRERKRGGVGYWLALNARVC